MKTFCAKRQTIGDTTYTCRAGEYQCHDCQIVGQREKYQRVMDFLKTTDIKLPLPVKLLPDTTYAERSFSMDASHENGNYSRVCSNCGRNFEGYKRRVTCCACETSSEDQKMYEALLNELGKILIDETV